MHVDKTVGIEVLLDLRISPVDGNAPVEERLDDLLGGIARVAFVLEGDRELAPSEPGDLVLDRTTEVVADPSARIDGFPRIEFLEEFDSPGGGLVAVDEIAEPVDAAAHVGEGTIHPGVAGIVEVPPERGAPVAFVPETFVGEGVIGLLPVRGDVFAGEEDPDRAGRVEEVLAASVIPVEEEVGLLVDAQVKMPQKTSVRVCEFVEKRKAISAVFRCPDPRC